MNTTFIKVKYNYLEDSSLNDTDRVIYGFIVGMIENKKTTGKFFMTNKEMNREHSTYLTYDTYTVCM